jgi:hypothetical protein
MARKSSAAADENFDWTAAEPTPAAEAPRRTGGAATKPNPWLRWVDQSLQTGQPLDMTYPVEQHDAATNLIQRAAQTLKCGHKKSYRDNGDGTETVTFLATYERKTSNYTSADVRAWARAEGYEEQWLKPRIHQTVRNAYRIAHGYKIDERDDA